MWIRGIGFCKCCLGLQIIPGRKEIGIHRKVARPGAEGEGQRQRRGFGILLPARRCLSIQRRAEQLLRERVVCRVSVGRTMAGPGADSDVRASVRARFSRISLPHAARYNPTPRLFRWKNCCDNGCNCCVWDIHADELEHYAHALAAWRARHPEKR
jgi:hypothetical protein